MVSHPIYADRTMKATGSSTTPARPTPARPTLGAIVAARRSPIGTSGRSLAGLGVDELAAPVLRRVVEDVRHLLPQVPPEDVVLGNARGPGGSVARLCALQAGLGHEVPGVTVDRQCASGLEAVVYALAQVATGRRLVLAGGVESGSQADDGRAVFAPAGLDLDMGEAAEVVASEAGIDRTRQDRFAARSHARAVAAATDGRFDDELVALGGLLADERPRAGFSVERLARFPAAFVEGGTVTAANSCGINDGAAIVAVVPEHLRATHHLPGLQVLGTGVAGVDPARCGLGLVPAAELAMAQAGITAEELGVVEVNEAFAGQVLAALDALGIPEERCSPDGGAIALGHPWGASGTVLLVRLFSRLVRQHGTDPTRPYGLAAIAAGGGQGVAVVVRAAADVGA